MFASYFKIAIRYLGKNKTYSFINIAGLSVSLACAMLIILYAKDEFSFDKFHKDINTTYLVAIDVQNSDGSSADKMGLTSLLHGPRFKDNLPEVESFVRLNTTYLNIKLGEDINSQKVLEADSNFFSFFSFPLLKGNPQTALQNIHSVVISEDMALQHFGNDDALTKTIFLESNGTFVPYTVTGVSKRCQQNSSIQFDIVMPLIEKPDDLNWVSVSLSTFVKLNERNNSKVVSSKMQEVFEAESKEVMEQVRKYGFTQSFYHHLQPFNDVHLSQEIKAEAGLTNASSSIYSYILSGIALLILTIACINFINLTIARSAKRAKEIGIRKVVGGARQQLITQFLGESFLLCFLSFIAAIMLAQLLLPHFNNLVNKELSLVYLIDSQLIIIYLSLLTFTGFLAGFYPAIILSVYNPVQTLYAKFKLSGKNYLQKALILFQFSLATFMVIATAIVYMQFDFLTSKDLGYKPDYVVKVNKRKLTHQEAKIFSEALSKNANIVSLSPQHHGKENGKINTDSVFHFTYEAVNENFIDLFNIKIAQGRNFSANNISDSANSVIINQAFVKKAGWKEPIGKEVTMMDGAVRKVIGIVEDYNYESLKKTIEPQLFSLAFNVDYPFYQHLLIKIQPNSTSNVIPYIEKTFKELFPMHPFTYQFYDDINLLNYQMEAKWKQVILLSALLTIFIAGIGLFGLSILTVESKYKEIGIRKVLGASEKTIVFSLYKNHLTLIFLAFLIAIPSSYYAGSVWLNNYPYRIKIGLEIFIGAGLFVLTIAALTISYQTRKAALLNPVDSLRTE
ncbi:MAG: ABC transporter permease [Chryseotalea sp.]|jgi:putative ABC transport system permease protein